MTKPSIKWKIFGYFMVFVLVIMAILWIFQVIFLEYFYKAIKTQDLKLATYSLERALALDEPKDELEKIASKHSLSVKIIDAETFDELFSIGSGMSGSVLHMLRASETYILFEKTEESGGESFQTYQTDTPDRKREKALYPNEQYEGFKRGKPSFLTLGINQTLLFSRIAKIDGKQYFIMADSVITPIDSTVMTLRTQLVFVSLIAIVISLILVTLISKHISTPIMKINESAKKLAKGEYDEHFAGEGYLEIEQLSDTLNTAAKELKKSEDLQRELIANTSHDLRTPLTMIIGYGEMMRDVPGENNSENIGVIIDEAKRLSELVNDLLDMSKLRSGTEKLNYSVFDFTKSTADIVERFKRLFENENYEIKHIYGENVRVYADEKRITQVIYNLLSNAVHYTGENKRITVTQRVVGGKVRLEVSDTGDGIAAENLPNIWDRYYKIDKTHTRSSVGSGIGLSIVKSILELHREKYGVISEVGHGSTFWFELGRAEE